MEPYILRIKKNFPEEEMERPFSFWGYKEQESNLILPEHDDDDDDDDEKEFP